MRSPGIIGLVLFGCAALTSRAAAQQRITFDPAADGPVAATGSITIRAEPTLQSTGRLAVFIDGTDITALLEARGDRWVYDAAALPFVSGAHEVVAWIVTADSTWQEAARSTFRVPGAFGVDSAMIAPTLELGVKSRLASRFEPADPTERSTYNDLDGRFELGVDIRHYRGTRVSATARVVGNSERDRALRFSELQDNAPLVDLAEWSVRLEHTGARLTTGNISTGSSPHLIQGFSSRGAQLEVGTDSRVRVVAAALHGSNVVGWSEPLGLRDPDHRILAGTLAVDALDRPGALRFEITALDGSVLPRTGFDRGAIVDAETSTGYALRVQSQLLDSRIGIDAGYTTSTSDNPVDPDLARDAALVPVERETRGARYAHASVALLRRTSLFAGRSISLTAGFRHERVDPLFRTVATYTRADQLQNRLDVRGDIAGLTVNASHARAHNNLDGIESILTSHTRRTTVDATLPLGTVLTAASWLPALRGRIDRTHQFGAGVPVNGGFSESHVPDQVSVDWSLGAEVRTRIGTFGYAREASSQDNRQTGRENADLERLTHAIRTSVRPIRSLSARIDVAWTEALSVEREETDVSHRIGASLDWTPLAQYVLGFQLSAAQTRNDMRDATREDLTWSVQWSSPVPGLGAIGGSLLLRFARAHHEVTSGDDVRRNVSWMIDTGFNLGIR